jgi:hypothetical protein
MNIYIPFGFLRQVSRKTTLSYIYPIDIPQISHNNPYPQKKIEKPLFFQKNNTQFTAFSSLDSSHFSSVPPPVGAFQLSPGAAQRQQRTQRTECGAEAAETRAGGVAWPWIPATNGSNGHVQWWVAMVNGKIMDPHWLNKLSLHVQ